MYKIILAVAVFSGAISFVAAANLNQKVGICHLTGNGGAQLQQVGNEALSSHLKHGDVLPGDPVPGETDKIYSADCSVVDAPVLGPSISAGATAITEATGVLWRGESEGSEVLIGVPDLTDLTQSNGSDKTWNSTVARVTFNFDKGANAVSSTVDGVATVYYFDDATQSQCTSASWDTMQVFLTDVSDGGAMPNVSVSNLTLGGFPLGDIQHSGTGNAAQGWTVSGFDFTQSFTLAGDLLIEGFWQNGDATSVGVTVGCS